MDFKEFARARTLSLRRTAYLLCGDWHLAEDLVQQALMKLYKAWRRIEDAEAVNSYARQVLLRCWLDEQRKPWRRRENRDGVVPEREQTDMPLGISDSLRTALLAISPKQRAVVVLRYCMDLSAPEVATILGCPEGTVKSQAARGLEALRARMGQLERSL